MSRENVEIVRRFVEAWQRDDFETFLSAVDPDVEWYTPDRMALEGAAGAYRGIDGMRELWTVWRTDYEDFQLEGQEIRDLGDDGVLHLAHIRWRGRASGIEVESPLGQVITVRHGKIARSVDYLSHDKALEAVRLRKYGMSRENVEIVRRAIEAFNRRDLDAAAQYFDPDAQVDWSRSRGLEAGVYRGAEEARAFWRTFFDTFDEIAVTPQEFVDAGDQVVVPNHASLSGRDGIKVEARSAWVVTLRHGRIVEWTLYQEKAEALEAVGLRE